MYWEYRRDVNIVISGKTQSERNQSRRLRTSLETTSWRKGFIFKLCSIRGLVAQHKFVRGAKNIHLLAN